MSAAFALKNKNGIEMVMTMVFNTRTSTLGTCVDYFAASTHPQFQRVILEYIIVYLTHLFNTILTTLEFPSMWKHTKIIPLPKHDGKYRQMAILPYLSKVFERLVHEQIGSHLYDNSLLTNRQSSCRPKHSCVTALVDVVEDLRSKMDLHHSNITQYC